MRKYFLFKHNNIYIHFMNTYNTSILETHNTYIYVHFSILHTCIQNRYFICSATIFFNIASIWKFKKHTYINTKSDE